MNCRICNSTNLQLVLSLGNSPWCNQFLFPTDPKPEIYPLELFYCTECGLAQLGYTIKKELMFSNHTYVSGTTKTLAQHFYNLALENKLQFNLKSNDLIVDIGGNDGTQLLQYQKLGFNNLVNIESASNIAAISDQAGISTFAEYFDEKFVDKFLANKVSDSGYYQKTDYPKAALINASGVFFHLEELHSVCRGIKKLLADEGVFVVQFMYLKDIIDNCAFDAIYHEHLCYYSLNSLMNLMSMYDMVLLDAYEHPIHGGSMMAKFVHSSSAKVRTRRAQQALNDEGMIGLIELEEFAKRVESKKNSIREFLLNLKKQGKKIYGFGSPASATTILNYCGIDNTILDKLVEINQLKVGRISPITNIPIVLEADNDVPDVFFVLSYKFIDEILQKKSHLLDKVSFVLPLPEIRVLGKEL